MTPAVVRLRPLTEAAPLFPELPALCRLDEVATALRTSKRTVRRLIASGRLRVARLEIGGSSRVLIPRAELERIVQESLL